MPGQRGLDLATTQDQTRMPTRFASLHPHSGCPHYKHDPSLFTWRTEGDSDANTSYRYLAILEDCDHLFARCPVAQAVWALTRVVRPRLSSMEDFWRSMADGPYQRRAEWQLIFATLWVIWNHRNEVVFRGRTPSVDAVVHEAGPGSFMEPSWLRPLDFCTPLNPYFVFFSH